MDPHRHAWAVLGFELAGERPIVRQRCACGAERVVPAWDRTWTPPPRWRLVMRGPLSGRLMESSSGAAGQRDDSIDVDVWSDVACPWCYIGKRNLEAGIAAFPEEEDSALTVRVIYHSFELDPDAPLEFAGSADEYLAERKGIDVEGARQMHDRVTAIAAEAGLSYDFASARRSGTAKAHQLIHHARASGLQDQAVERLFAAQFSEGRNIGSVEELAEIGSEIGLPREELERALAADAHLAAVRADEQQAAAIGINGVPFYVFDGRYGLSGAQPPAVFAEALRQVLIDRGALGAAS